MGEIREKTQVGMVITAIMEMKKTIQTPTMIIAHLQIVMEDKPTPMVVKSGIRSKITGERKWIGPSILLGLGK